MQSREGVLEDSGASAPLCDWCGVLDALMHYRACRAWEGACTRTLVLPRGCAQKDSLLPSPWVAWICGLRAEGRVGLGPN